MPFYNTNQENSKESSESLLKTANQETAILGLFSAANFPMSPSMVYKALGEKWPITSIRRAITDLTDEGKIVKTQKTTKGIYGKKEHLWELPKKPEVFEQVALFDF